MCVFDTDSFAARWSSHGVGSCGCCGSRRRRSGWSIAATRAGRQATPSIQLVYARKGTLNADGGKRFTVRPGEFVLLDNTRFYQMEMDTAHEAVDLMSRSAGSTATCPILARCSGGRSPRATAGGAARQPARGLVEGLGPRDRLDPLPRPMIAEEVGTLLTLATGFHEPATESRHRGQLARQILRRIETDFADPDLSPEGLAAELGISRRYLQQLLAGSGTSFVQELTATRLDRASDMLSDPRAGGLSVGEIAFRCGFLDPGYFARAFRKRFGRTPSEWRGSGIRS